MAETVLLEYEGGFIEVELPASDVATRGFVDDVPQVAAKTFDQALAGVRVLATGIQKTLAAVAPDAMTVEFGLTIKGSGNFIIASGETVTNLKVTLQWKKG